METERNRLVPDNKLATGIYQLEITTPAGEMKVLKVMY